KYKPNISISSYDKNHPKYIQDIGEMFEIALENYRKAGLKEAVIKPGWIWGQTINHVNIKLDSYTAQISSEPSYLSHTGYIHLGAELYLTDFRGDETSCCFVGHELFHRIQAEYYNFTRFKRAQDFWWIEACAEYAADRVAWKNNINTWTGKQYWKMFKQIPNDLLSHPLNTTGKPNAKYKNEYEYHASVFIYYLVEVCGYDFATLINSVSQGAPLVKLDEFLRSKTGGSNGMAYHYSAFARWAFFTEGSYASGFFKNFPLADFSGTNANELAEKKETITMPTNKEVSVSLTGSKDVSVEVYKIMNGAKLSGNQAPKSIAVVQDGQTAKITGIKPGEILFFMAVNTGGTDASVNLKLFEKAANKPADDLCEYTFSFKDSYSAKLFAVKPKDLELKISPDTISDGKLNEKYTFELKAENIPANVSSVYFKYDFDNIADKKAKGKTAPVSVDKDKNVESEIEYTWKSATKKSVVKVRMMNAANNKELATAQAIVQFYTVKILGDRNISYVLTDASAKEYKQKFVAEASPAGDFKFEWDFGDGTKSGKIAGKNQKSEIEHIYKNLKPGQEFKPKVKLYDQNDNLLAEDEIYISVDDDSKPDNKPDDTPVASSTYSLDFRIYAFANYTEGYSDAQQSWPKSEYTSYESIWDLQIGKGSSFSGNYTFGSTTQSWSGEYNNQMMKSFKYTFYRKWNSGSTMIREEWMTIELRNIPVEPDNTSEYGIRFGLDGWDCDKQKPNPNFENSIVKLEHKFKFYPSGKEISLVSLDYYKSEVYACNNWQNLWIPRAHLFVGISYNK
ncbi:MAG: hypothetical protein PHE56_04815, partial [Bacteroidales bacterium]|nr:hypothetical protein [Bacteroidales bacterium]